jgi:TetR/AcrR family transcriptional repressor of nem operon
LTSSTAPVMYDEPGPARKVLLAVREQFWCAGYAATSLEDLMRVSGLGKGSLYGVDHRHHRSVRAARLPHGQQHRRTRRRRSRRRGRGQPHLRRRGAQQEGDLPADADPLDTARALLTAQQGITYTGRAGTDIATLATTANTLARSLLGTE